MCLLFHDVYDHDPSDSGFCSAAANRYKLTLAQFDRHLASVQRAPEPVLPFVLSFDDGGLSYYTAVADRLESRGWRAHCFVPTDFIGRTGFLTASQIRELDARGHHIGSHSASHPARISACSPGEILDEWTRSLDVLQNLLGHPVWSASIPGGYFSTAVAEAAATAGIRTLFTSEPTTRVGRIRGCAIVGRYTVRQASAPDLCAGLVRTAPWSRSAAWAAWNAKALIKPVLGSFYMRAAGWLLDQKPAAHSTSRQPGE